MIDVILMTKVMCSHGSLIWFADDSFPPVPSSDAGFFHVSGPCGVGVMSTVGFHVCS